MAEINMIRVRAKPPFLRLRPGLSINQSQHRPFTTAIRIIYYKNLSLQKGGMKVGSE